jgi:hypothetical protein
VINRFAFIGAEAGTWRVTSQKALSGEALDEISHLDIVAFQSDVSRAPGNWPLIGAKSNLRYTTRTELNSLRSRQEGLGRPQATRAALIPLRKSAAWWDLSQDERRAIFEEQSHHSAIGLDYLPAIARQLYHCRDLDEPFDFLTWFEFAPEHTRHFDNLLERLRRTREWSFVEREVEIRLERAIHG